MNSSLQLIDLILILLETIIPIFGIALIVYLLAKNFLDIFLKTDITHLNSYLAFVISGLSIVLIAIAIVMFDITNENEKYPPIKDTPVQVQFPEYDIFFKNGWNNQ